MNSLDKLPAPVRHGLMVFFGAASSKVIAAITTANGVTGVDWRTVLEDALNVGATATVSVLLVMYITPLTKQYGVKGKTEK